MDLTEFSKHKEGDCFSFPHGEAIIKKDSESGKLILHVVDNDHEFYNTPLEEVDELMVSDLEYRGHNLENWTL